MGFSMSSTSSSAVVLPSLPTVNPGQCSSSACSEHVTDQHAGQVVDPTEFDGAAQRGVARQHGKADDGDLGLQVDGDGQHAGGVDIGGAVA